MLVNNDGAGLRVGQTPIEPNNRYVTFIPRRNETKGELKQLANGEFGYEETDNDAGYYDSNFETIEGNDDLMEFYTLAKEIMDESTSWLPPDQQRQLFNNAFLGIRKRQRAYSCG